MIGDYGFIFNFWVKGGEGMALDTSETFDNSNFKPKNIFKVNCVGSNQSKGFVESLYNSECIPLEVI